MSTLKLLQFSGEIPRILPRLLPETGAQLAENVRLDDGGLTPVRGLRLEHGFGDIPIQTIYKHGDTWLSWDAVVNAAPGPVATDRLYYTGDGVPKMRVGSTVYNLKVPAPTGAISASTSGTGAGDVTTLIWVYTYVTDFGEESEPCPVSNEINWQSGLTITLSGFALPPAGRNITKQRIYQLQNSIATGADLFLIEERAASTSNYVYTTPFDDFAEVLPSRDWNPPPDGLKGLIALPNGMMAGFVGKDLYFCEPYRPHAWPEKYVLTMDFEIVALGAYGSTLVVATTGQPYLVAGTSPDVMQQGKLELNAPCINPRGLVDMGYAVAYPSHDGLVIVSGGAATIGTEAVMTRTDWLRTSPGSFVAGQFSGRYFASFDYLGIDGTSTEGTFIFDLTGSAPFMLRASIKAECMFYDVIDSKLYVLIGKDAYEWDALGRPNEIMSYKTRQFIFASPVTFGCIYIESASELSSEEQAAIDDAIQAVIDANTALLAMDSIGGEINGAAYNTYPFNGDALLPMPVQEYASVSVYADGQLAANVSQLDEVVRLPAVAKARRIEVLASGTKAIAQITLATSPRELNAV